MTDIIARAEAALAGDLMPRNQLYPMIHQLVTELKAARAHNKRLTDAIIDGAVDDYLKACREDLGIVHAHIAVDGNTHAGPAHPCAACDEMER